MSRRESRVNENVILVGVRVFLPMQRLSPIGDPQLLAGVPSAPENEYGVFPLFDKGLLWVHRDNLQFIVVRCRYLGLTRVSGSVEVVIPTINVSVA